MRTGIARLATMVLLGLTLATPACANWLEASTDHFVIDASSSEARLRDFATRLERFDAALHTIYGVADDPARRADRVLIIATSRSDIERLAGAGVAGFYRPRAGRSMIFTGALVVPPAPEAQIGSRLAASTPSFDLGAQATLLHEYSHHFMYSNFTRAYPYWFAEGFAEFNGNARFDPDGNIVIGGAANYRAAGLELGSMLPLEMIFERPPQMSGAQMDQFYGMSWLLTHYLMVEGKQQDALNHYLDAFNAGKPSLEAARDAFGDLRALKTRLSRLLNSPTLGGLGVSVPMNITIEITPLSPGAVAMMPVHMISINGVTKVTAPGVAADAEHRAAPFPKDPRVQDELAEAEFDAARYDLADAAANRALAVAPDDVTAILYKGRVAICRLQAASIKDPTKWKDARGWFARANHAAPDAAEPLLLYYRSFLAAGAQPPEIAFAGLSRARELASEDGEIRLLIAARLLDDGKKEDARAMLNPLALSPHNREDKDRAQAALVDLDADKADKARAELLSGEDIFLSN